MTGSGLRIRQWDGRARPSSGCRDPQDAAPPPTLQVRPSWLTSSLAPPSSCPSQSISHNKAFGLPASRGEQLLTPTSSGQCLPPRPLQASFLASLPRPPSVLQTDHHPQPPRSRGAPSIPSNTEEAPALPPTPPPARFPTPALTPHSAPLLPPPLALPTPADTRQLLCRPLSLLLVRWPHLLPTQAPALSCSISFHSNDHLEQKK